MKIPILRLIKQRGEVLLREKIVEQQARPSLRMQNGAVRVTEEGHRILDVMVPADRDIAEVVAAVRDLAGVVETGYFPRQATEAIIATETGIRRMSR